MRAPDQDVRDRIVAARGTNLAVEAGAGTGKTTLLVERVTDLVRTGTPLSRLAVITFTRKAAAELEARLVRCLAEARADGEAWAVAALDDLPRADIGTTDSFCRSILADFALEAGVPAGFGLADEIAQEALLDVAWGRFLARATDADARLFTELRELGVKTSTLREVADAFVEQRDLTVAQPPRSEQAPLLDVFASGLAPALALKDRCSDPSDRLRQRLDELERDLEVASSVGRAAGERALLAKETYATTHGRKEAWGGGSTKNDVVAALRRLDEAVQAWRRHRAAARAADVAAWLSRYATEYERLKRERGVVDFRDLALATRNLLRDRDAVRRRVAARWDALLLDEAQDTDPLQMEIALLLAAREPVPADPFDASLTPGRLFLVGDPKQSIYRFRRADLELYTRTRGVVEASGERATIQANFRSHPSILRFVNGVFDGWMRPAEGASWQASYVELVPGASSAAALDDAHEPPRVSLLLPDPDVRAEIVRGAPAAKLQVEERTDLEIDAVVRGIRRVLGRDGTGEAWRVVDPVTGTERGARPADVCVLTRHTAWGDRLLDALRRVGIPATSTAGRGFHAREEIRTLSILLRAVLDPSDMRALFAALRCPALAVTDDDLVLRFLDARSDGPGAHAPLTSPAAIDAESRLRALAEDARRLSPGDFLEHLAEELALFPAFGFRPDGAARIENLRLVIEAAAPLAEAGFDSLPDFVRWLAERGVDDRLGLGEIEPPGGELVSILTIHKAKGLEFPIVVIADLGGQTPPASPIVADRAVGTLEFRLRKLDVETAGFKEGAEQEKLRRGAEEMRLLYVAATRARDHLILSWPEGDQSFLKDDMLPSRLGTRPGEPPPEGSEIGVLRAEELPSRGSTASVHVVDVESAVALGRAAAGTGELFAEAGEDAEADRPRRRILPVTAFAELDRVSPDFDAEDADGTDRAEAPRPLVRSGHDLNMLYGRSLGSLVHASLEAWDSAAPFEQALSAAVDTAILRADSPIEAEARSELLARLRPIARDPAVAEVLRQAGPNLREVPFLLPLGDDFLSGTVDAILDRADGTLALVDYKTERIVAGGADAAAAQHHRQAALYAYAVEHLTQRHVAEVRLLFLATSPVTVTTFADREDLLRTAGALLSDPAVRRRLRGSAAPAEPDVRTRPERSATLLP